MKNIQLFKHIAAGLLLSGSLIGTSCSSDYMDKFMVIEPQMLRENIKTKLENTLEIMNNINGSQ